MNYQYDDLSGGYADNSAFAVGDDGKFQPISHRQTHHEQKENNIYRHNYTTISSSSSAAASSAASSSIEIHSGNRTNAYKPHNHKNNNPTTNKSDQSEQIVNFAKHIIEKYNTEKNMDTIYEPNATIILNSNTMCYGSQWNFILKLFPNIRTTNTKIKNQNNKKKKKKKKKKNIIKKLNKKNILQ
eukprot:844054_1